MMSHVVVHGHDLEARCRQEDLKFGTSLAYRVRPCLKKKKYNKSMPRNRSNRGTCVFMLVVTLCWAEVTVSVGQCLDLLVEVYGLTGAARFRSRRCQRMLMLAGYKEFIFL